MRAFAYAGSSSPSRSCPATGQTPSTPQGQRSSFTFSLLRPFKQSQAPLVLTRPTMSNHVVGVVAQTTSSRLPNEVAPPAGSMQPQGYPYGQGTAPTTLDPGGRPSKPTGDPAVRAECKHSEDRNRNAVSSRGARGHGRPSPGLWSPQDDSVKCPPVNHTACGSGTREQDS